MKAWMLDHPGNSLALRDIAVPVPRLGAVLVRMQAVPLPLPYGELMRNNWELIGHFMYTPADYAAQVALAGSGQLPLDAVGVQSFGFHDLEAAIDSASSMEGLQSTVVRVAA